LFDTTGNVQTEANECIYSGHTVMYDVANPGLEIVESAWDSPSPVCSADHLVRLISKALTDVTSYTVEGDNLILHNNDLSSVMSLTLGAP